MSSQPTRPSWSGDEARARVAGRSLFGRATPWAMTWSSVAPRCIAAGEAASPSTSADRLKGLVRLARCVSSSTIAVRVSTPGFRTARPLATMVSASRSALGAAGRLECQTANGIEGK